MERKERKEEDKQMERQGERNSQNCCEYVPFRSLFILIKLPTNPPNTHYFSLEIYNFQKYHLVCIDYIYFHNLNPIHLLPKL